VAGYDLTAPLEDFAKTVWQGINGPVFALLALDSLSYPSARRAAYVGEILDRQMGDGGWNLRGSGGGDPDVTGMALQALAKYQSQPAVKAATDKALAFLSRSQDAAGGYAGWGEANVESSVQVLVALCELGISVDDTRFVKNGKNLIDNILSFANGDGSFNHNRDGGGVTLMSTEQALYGLVAAQRAANGQRGLYRMEDIVRRGGFAQLPGDSGLSADPGLPAAPSLPAAPGLPGKHEDVRVMPVTNPGKTFGDIQNHPNQAAIEALAARGIIAGRSEAAFAPEVTMTRAEFAALVTTGLGLGSPAQPETPAGQPEHPFDDVPAAAWYARPVAAAYSYGIVAGTAPTAFSPDATITRQEAAVMVARAAGLCGMDTARADTAVRDTLAQFGDYRDAASWAQTALAFCYDAGLLDDSEPDIQPGEAVTRREIGEMLYRLLDKAQLL
jgi:hypothetical protein